MAKLEKLARGTTSSIDEDRISSLPDSLICHVLSFLPTITSVTTSILSRRWRHLWKDLQVLYFDKYTFPIPRARHFVAFVNTVLEKRKFRHIKKFHLSSNVEEHDSLDVSIRAAIGPLLEELHLRLLVLSGEFDFPHGVFTCKSLVSLNLECYMHLCDPPSVHLPSLKYLRLKIATLDSIDVILSGCPVLETLVLILNLIETPAIHMPRSLKSLTFVEDGDYPPIFEDLEIDTPHLEYLYITTWNCIQNLNLASNFPNMVEARLDICQDHEHIGLVVKLLKALCRTKLLVLSNSTLEFLLDVPSLDFPEFSCLLHLQLELPYFDLKFLINLLHNCPMLQVLKIDNQESESLSDPSFEQWTQATSVPNCVTSELEIFEFKRYADSGNERALVAYILQRGLVLKMMTIHTYAYAYASFSQKEEDSKKLSILPRASNICQLEVDGIKL